MPDLDKIKLEMTLIDEETFDRLAAERSNDLTHDFEFTSTFKENRNEFVLPALMRKKKTIEEHFAALYDKFPRIHDELKLMWGSQECHDRLAKLLWVDTEGRSGFPAEVVEALIGISNRHAEEFKTTRNIDADNPFIRKDIW